MKTVKEIVFVLFTLVLFGACNDPRDDIGQKVTTQQTNFHLEATATENVADLQDELYLQFTNITECNLAESMFVVLDSKISSLNERDFMIREGNIDFLVPNSGCSLVATFYGKGIITEDRFILNATIDVEFGTGTLCTDGGELSLKVVGVQTPDQLMKYTIEIDGYLESRLPKAN